MLRLEQVEKSFDSLRAVDGVSLTVDQGQIIGLIGPNGSGKSTLLNLIGGTLTPDAGQIYFAGEDVTQQPVDASHPHVMKRLDPTSHHLRRHSRLFCDGNVRGAGCNDQDMSL